MPRRLLSDVSDQVRWPIGVILQITVPRYPMFFSFKSLPPKKKKPATLLTRTALQGCHWRVLSFFCRQTSRMKKWLQHYRLWKVPFEATLGFCFLKKSQLAVWRLSIKGKFHEPSECLHTGILWRIQVVHCSDAWYYINNYLALSCVFGIFF